MTEAGGQVRGNDEKEVSVTDENKQPEEGQHPEPDAPEQEQQVEEKPKQQRKGGRKPKAPEPTIGQIVRYVTSKGTERPAIITAVQSQTVVDLTVFNSQGAVPVTRVMNDPEAGDPHTWHWPESN